MKHKLLALLMVLFGTSCVIGSEYRYCDPSNGNCYICDSVSCRPAVVVPLADTGITTDVRDVTDGGPRECYSNLVCNSNSVCHLGNCHVPCNSINDCLRVDFQLRYCRPVDGGVGFTNLCSTF